MWHTWLFTIDIEYKKYRGRLRMVIMAEDNHLLRLRQLACCSQGGYPETVVEEFTESHTIDCAKLLD